MDRMVDACEDMDATPRSGEHTRVFTSMEDLINYLEAEPEEARNPSKPRRRWWRFWERR